jgi:hypothetical protein
MALSGVIKRVTVTLRNMMQFVVRVLSALAIVNAQTALAANIPSTGGRSETILIQTLTVSDEQFLKGVRQSPGAAASDAVDGATLRHRTAIVWVR